MANAEDLNRLTSCSLVLLGHIFLSLGNTRESMNMVTPAMQLASKIPDVHVQLWASAILKGKLFFNFSSNFLKIQGTHSLLRPLRHDRRPRARARGPPDAHLIYAEVTPGLLPRNAKARAQVGPVDGRPLSGRGGGQLQLGRLLNSLLLLFAATAAAFDATRGPDWLTLLTR